jgi:hypothetical protein
LAGAACFLLVKRREHEVKNSRTKKKKFRVSIGEFENTD